MTRRRALHSEAPPGERLAATAADLLQEAHAAVSPDAPADQAVHDFRKAIKRWRAFLRLIEPFAGAPAKNLQHAARDCARKLGRARDLRATLDAIDDLAGGGGPAEAVLDEARRPIRSLLAKAQSQESGMTLREAAAEVLRWQQEIARLDLAPIGIDEFAGAIAAGYRRARRAMPERLATAGEEAIHDFRKRVIDHRYQMELARPLSPRLAKRCVDDAQRLRDALGQHRDLALLRAMTEAGKPLQALRGALLPAIAKRREVHLAHAEKLASRLFAERPRAFRARLRKRWRVLAGEKEKRRAS